VYVHHVHELSGKFPNVQNSPPLRRSSGARQVLLSSNEFDELRRENRIALSLRCASLCDHKFGAPGDSLETRKLVFFTN
jgi:hypothetical protein